RRHSGLTTPLRVFSAARAAVRTVGRAAMVQANEAAMLMSAAAMTPLRLASGGFDEQHGTCRGCGAGFHGSQAGPRSPTPSAPEA
ncbi:MAG TPA: hypothetical protein VNY55_09290, partial [Mycobacterium sp.]|nr:hypothetical protein [Mycobacterium sp.]